jgi:hypothetical protein
LAITTLALFPMIEGWRGDRAMMPLALFASRSFVGLTLLTLLLYGALGALLVLVPYVLIEAADYSGTAAGAALLPLPLVLSLTSPMMGRLAGRLGSRLPLTLGSFIIGLGFLLALRFDGNYWTGVLPAILVIALGLSGAVAPLTTAPAATGSPTFAKTIGIVRVSRWRATVGRVAPVAMMSGCRPTNSCASARARLMSSPYQRRTIRTLWPSVQPKPASA